MMTEYHHTLTAKRCRECGKAIMVAEYSWHPLEDQASGMAADAWDSDRDDFVFVGWICNDCAFDMAMTVNGGGMVGGPGLSFAYTYRRTLEPWEISILNETGELVTRKAGEDA